MANTHYRPSRELVGAATATVEARPTLIPAGEIPNLNGMRAFAVLLVVIAHAGYEFNPGTFGVTTFFVLSGYLITTLLMREHAAKGSISFARFYARRALRLLPPLYIVTALVVLAVHFGLIAGRVEPGWILSTLFFFGNYWWLLIGPDSGMPHEIQLVWSLAVEEHFYAIWPPLALLFFRARNSRLSMSVFMASTLVAVLVWRAFLLDTVEEPLTYMSFATDSRIDSLLVGCWLAIVRNPLSAAPVGSLQNSDFAWLAASALVFIAPPLLPDSDSKLIWVLSSHPILLVPIFWLAVARHRLWPFRILSHPVLDYIGRISYTLYLIHWLAGTLVAREFPELPTTVRLLLTLSLAIAVSELIRRFVEEPIAVVRRRLSGIAPSRKSESCAP